MQIVDLSLPLENDAAWMPRWLRARVRYQHHRFGRLAARLLFGVRARHLATGLGWANEILHLSTHATTHVDAPWHFGPQSQGRPARTIDELPLQWCMGPGVVLDVRHLDPDAAADVPDLQQALLRIGHTLSPADIVLVQTGNDRLWGNREYHTRGPGVTATATRWLAEQGIRMMGIDAWSWDQPLAVQARQARKSGKNNIFWAAHYEGVHHECCHIERLANLEAVPTSGFTVCAFPLKVKRGSAGPARVVALLGDS
jgi:kynurenine formamidase